MTSPQRLESRRDPCQASMEKYMNCVKAHPNGLKEYDCEEEKNVFRQCMKEFKNRFGTSPS